MKWNMTNEILLKSSDDIASLSSAQAIWHGLYDSINNSTLNLKTVNVMRSELDTFNPLITCPAIQTEMTRRILDNE